MKYALCSVLLIYFFFTSGICYEIATPYILNHWESPYNIGLCAERNGVAPVATQDDINVINWMKVNIPERNMVSDYNGYLIQHAFMQNHVNGLRYFGIADKNVKSGDVIFLTSWNIRNQSYVEGIAVGTRQAYPLPDISRYPLLYKNGFAEVRLKL